MFGKSSLETGDSNLNWCKRPVKETTLSSSRGYFHILEKKLKNKFYLPVRNRKNSCSAKVLPKQNLFPTENGIRFSLFW